MVAHGRRVAAEDAVVEPLVVAEAEALLLERPLHVPVGLGDEHGVRVPGVTPKFRDHRGPEFLRWPLAAAFAPGPREHVVDHQHGHVAADPVAMAMSASVRAVAAGASPPRTR